MAYKSNTSFIKGIKSFTVQTYHYAVSLTKDHLVKQVAFEDTSPQEINQGSVFVSSFFMFQCKSVKVNEQFFNYIHQSSLCTYYGLSQFVILSLFFFCQSSLITYDLSILSQFPAFQ